MTRRRAAQPYTRAWHAEKLGRPAWAERLWRWMDGDAPVWLMVAVETPMQRLMCRLWGHEWAEDVFAGARITRCARCDG